MIPTLCYLILFFPLVFELIDDKMGDMNKAFDVYMRIVLGLLVALVPWIFDDRSYLASFAVSMGLHFFAFDYLISAILLRNGTIEPPRGVKYHWFSYLGNGFVDRVKWWREIGEWWRFGIRLGVLIVTNTIYWL